MLIDIYDLIPLFLLALGGWYWWSSMRMKELAHRAVRRHCREFDLQLLDDSIVLRGFWFRRDQQGRWQPWRSYLFEFTATGEERYRGKVVLLGTQVTNIELEAHRI